MTTLPPRDRAAIAIAALVIIGGLLALLFGAYDTGISWRIDADTGHLVVDDVAPLSQAARDGVAAGMIAVEVNGNQLIELPAYQYGATNKENPDQAPPIVGISPAAPRTVAQFGGEQILLSRQSIDTLGLITADALATGAPDRWFVQRYWYPGSYGFAQAQRAFLPGLILLVAGAWWLRSTRAGASLRHLALPLAVAVASPLLTAPLEGIGSIGAVLLGGGLTIAAMVPLAVGLTERVDRPDDRRLLFVLIAGLALAAGVSVLGYAIGDRREEVATLVVVLTGAVPLIPGLIAAGPIDLGRIRTGSTGPGGLLQATELALAGATPMVALATHEAPFLWPLGFWLIAIAVAGRFTVRPLARLATRAALQRDLVVAATEAERARLAADIHDDALQELTLLVRRLEASGDKEGAEIGRTVADRLRAICGDLRLPILDDLGVGPALDWLVLRIERLAGGEVRLERADEARHSPDVELAIFRVAQEALANAVKHGRPPIVVRYRSTPGGISLAIDDAGPGITDEAPADAEKAGRFGLLNMAQRAEQIGAILDVKRWPSGGTHVALEWRPR
ncbi:MAG TPA: ATP-binding protein [Verrucomicrobiae bacterium]|nr:ATP-binding protein [Verrucomicrobiae bacterium]